MPINIGDGRFDDMSSGINLADRDTHQRTDFVAHGTADLVACLWRFLRLLVCWQRLERLENGINIFKHDILEPLAQQSSLFVGEFTHDVEFVDGDLVQPFGDDDRTIPEIEVQRTDMLQLRECNGHFLTITQFDTDTAPIFVEFLITSEFIGFLIANTCQPANLGREGACCGVFFNTYETCPQLYGDSVYR